MIAFCVVLLDAASTLLVSADPGFALRLNPLNADARVAVAALLLERGTEADLAGLRQELARWARLHSRDARFRSLLGIERHRAGDTATAAGYFGQALAVQPTEIQALAHTAIYAARDRDFATAARSLEIVARRWPKAWPMVSRTLPGVLTNPQARAEFSRRFANEPRLAALLIDGLLADNSGLEAAYLLAMDWHESNAANAGAIADKVTRKLVANGRGAEAFTLFRVTREVVDAGYVFNGDFARDFSQNPFDWRIVEQAGVEFSRDGEGGGLAIRFLDSPVRLSNVSQLLRLAPGRYRLAVAFDATRLRAPKPLRFAAACTDSGLGLAQLPLPPGTASDADSVELAVPAEGCGLVRLTLQSAEAPASWKHRYDGVLRLRRVAIAWQGA